MSASVLQQLDSQLDTLFADWNIYTTLICLLLGAYLIYPLFLYTEPDTHPMLLARQSSNSYVRQPGESAIYRSLETPHGYPLKSGLNVKDPGAPKWTAGRDGDLKDIWAQVLKGPVGPDGNSAGAPGKIVAVLGKEEVIEHQASEITKDINSLGQYLRSHEAHRAAVYLPNSVEFIVSLFAAALYGITPTLVPFDNKASVIGNVLKDTNADCVIATAGSLPLDSLLKDYPGLKHVIWVAERSSRHMDWNEVPEGVGGKAEIAVWHEVVEEKRSSASAEISSNSSDSATPNLVTVSFSAEKHHVVEFSQKNFVAAVAAQISALPRSQRLGPSDILIPLTPLTDQYPLAVTLAALFSNSSVALTSVSGATADYVAAFRGITPTIMIASPQTLEKLHNEKAAAPGGLVQKMTHWRRARSLAAGSMPKVSGLATKPRLIYTFNEANSGSKPLTSSQLADLRVYTGAYIINAFTAAGVAGAISQTNMFDYQTATDAGSAAHYGPPLSSVEIKLVETPSCKITEEHFTEGQLVVEGPAVADGVITVDGTMKITDSNTLCSAR